MSSINEGTAPLVAAAQPRPCRASALGRMGEIAGLTALAVAQPLYDVFARQPEFFLARHTRPAELLGFVALLSLVLPLCLVLLDSAIRSLGRTIGTAFHLALSGMLVLLLALFAFNRLDLHPLLRVGAAAACCGAFVLLYHRSAGFRQVVRLLSLAAVVVPVAFLASGDVRSLVWPSDWTAATGARRPAPVVVVVFDELPLTSLLDSSGAIDATRFPKFAELARTGTWYANATSPAPVTNYAVPAILSGLYPSRSRVPSAEDYPQNLFTSLAGSHELFVHESATRLCPTDLCEGGMVQQPSSGRMSSLLRDAAVVYLHLVLPRRFLADVPSIDHRWGGFEWADAEQEEAGDGPASNPVVQALKEDRVALFRQFVDRIEGGRPQPPVFFMHLLLPHTPWVYYPSLRRYTGEEPDRVLGLDSRGLSWAAGAVTVELGYQRHLLQVGAVDTLVGELLEKLKREDLFDRAMIVLVADHGASFEVGDAYRMVTSSNVEKIATVPLLIKYPGQTEGRRVDDPVETIDVFPTIAEVLGVDLSLPVDGTPLVGNRSPPRGTRRIWDFFTEWRDVSRELRAVVPVISSEVDRRIDLFGEGPWDGAYGWGHHSDLIGKRVASFPIVGDPAIRASVDQLALLERVDPTAPVVPGLIDGIVEGVEPGAESSRLVVAVALNGVIGAVTPTYRNRAGQVAYTVVVPERLLIEGRNSAEIFHIVRSPGGVTLSRIGGEPSGYRLVQASGGGGEQISASTGELLPVRPGAVDGFVDFVEVHDGIVEIRGWAIDLGRKTPSESLMVFIDGECAFCGRPEATYRPDMEKHYGLPWAGYKIILPEERLEGEVTMRVFGVATDGVASELAYHDWYRWR